MAYTKTVWVTGDVISQAKANNWETQYDEAVKLVGVFTFGGRDTYLESSTTYMAGSGADKVVPGSGFWSLVLTDLSGGTYQLQAMMRVNAAGAVGNAGLFNLSGAPDTILTGSLLTGTGSTAGEFVSSGAITFPASGVLGIKSKISNAAYGVSVWNARLRRMA